MDHIQQDAATALAKLVLSRTSTEATATPYWFIAVKNPVPTGTPGVKMVSRGIWFNREDAEHQLSTRAYKYPKSAFVYCQSGHESKHLEELYRLANIIAGGEQE